MATVEERVSRTVGVLPTLATKADAANLKVWVLTVSVTVGAAVVAVLKLWQ